MIGEALRLVRVFHDVKLTDLSKKVGVSAGYLSEIENGKKQPTITLIEKYACEFETTTSAIMFFSEQLDPRSTKSKVKRYIRANMIKFLQAVERAAS